MTLGDSRFMEHHPEARVSAHPPHSHTFNIFVSLYGFDIVNMLIKKLGFFNVGFTRVDC